MQRSSLTEVLRVQHPSIAVFATVSIKTDRRVDRKSSQPSRFRPTGNHRFFRAFSGRVHVDPFFRRMESEETCCCWFFLDLPHSF